MLRESKPLIAQDLQDLVDRFYEFQVKIPEISRLIGDAESLARLKNSMRNYILDLFDSQLDPSYVLSRLRIGQVHKRIGVPPKLYIAAVRYLQLLLRSRLIDKEEPNCPQCGHRLNALNKMLLFDLTLVFDTYIFSLMDEVERGKEELESYAQGLEQVVAQRTRELSEMARRDGLTGLFNQKSFFEELRRELSRSQRTNTPISLVYMDIDGFKQINDTRGHEKGDKVLKAVSDEIAGSTRIEDMAARYGGDEFVMILSQTDQTKAVQVCERMVERMRGNQDLAGLSLSLGLASTGPDTYLHSDELVRAADQAMYKSKEIQGYHITLAESPGFTG